MIREKIVLVAAHRPLAQALGMAIEAVKNLKWEYYKSLTLVPLEREIGALCVVLEGARDSRVPQDFFLLRHLLMGPHRPQIGPIALFGYKPSLFDDEAIEIPIEEKVRYFGVPFELKSVLDFLTPEDSPVERRTTRILLRSRLTNDEIRLFSTGDAHGLGHFRPLIRALERSIGQGERGVFVNDQHGESRRPSFLTDIIAAEAMIDSLESITLPAEFLADGKRLVEEMKSVAEYFRKVAEGIEKIIGGGKISENEWPHMLEEIKKLERGQALQNDKKWQNAVISLCRRIAAGI